jgi:hypothetical protein
MAFESLLTYARPQIQTVSRRLKTTPSLDLVRDGWAGAAYNEEAFRHFLEIERTRADRSKRKFLLLLVSLRRCPRDGVKFSSGLSGPLFLGMRECVREIDFIGWYREGQVAGAVLLTQGQDGSCSDAPTRIVDRVTSILGQRMPRDITDRLLVRVVHVGAKAA